VDTSCWLFIAARAKLLTFVRLNTCLRIGALANHREHLESFAPEAVVDTYAMTAEHAESAVPGLPDGLRRVVLSSGCGPNRFCELPAPTPSWYVCRMRSCL
jgi:hypothetical protein